MEGRGKLSRSQKNFILGLTAQGGVRCGRRCSPFRSTVAAVVAVAMIFQLQRDKAP